MRRPFSSTTTASSSISNPGMFQSVRRSSSSKSGAPSSWMSQATTRSVTAWASSGLGARNVSTRELVEGCSQPASVARGERVIGPELPEEGDHDLPDALAALGIRGLELAEQPLEDTLVVLLCEWPEDLGELPRVRKLREQELRRGWSGQPLEKLLDDRRRHRAGELVHDLAVPEGLHVRDPAHAVALGELLVRVRVDLGEDDGTAARLDRVLEDRGQHLARAAPVGPEVDDDRDARGAFDHVLLEGFCRDVHLRLWRAPSRRALVGLRRRSRLPGRTLPARRRPPRAS